MSTNRLVGVNEQMLRYRPEMGRGVEEAGEVGVVFIVLKPQAGVWWEVHRTHSPER